MPVSPTRRSQRERREATTGQLLAAARELFAHRGYAATSLDDVVAECGVTKGALYHHFDGKGELFEAVFIEEERKLCARLIEASSRKRDPVEAFEAGCMAFLQEALDPGVQQITLLDAPSVLGWARMRAIQAEYGLALLKEGLRRSVSAKRLSKREVDPLAHLFFGALCEAAGFIAGSEDQVAALRKVRRELKRLIAAMT